MSKYLVYLFVIYASISSFCWGLYSIDDFGAVPESQTLRDVRTNTQAFQSAVDSANNDKILENRIVLIPAGHTYYMTAVSLSFLKSVEVRINGNITYIDDIKAWPKSDGGKALTMLSIEDSDDVTLTGGGHIDGQGLKWWRLTYSGKEIRPYMFEVSTSINIHIYDLHLYDAPKNFIKLSDLAYVHIHDLTIFVDSSLYRTITGNDSVTFPLNTDAIDVKATHVSIHDCNITNYDDAIVAKPCTSAGKYCQCASHMDIYNNQIYYSLGYSVGSVAPSEDITCVSNVTFRDSTLYRPVKALYVTTNPGESGSGVIEDITYRNIHIEGAIQWTIYIGPQQQNQPGPKEGTGCSFGFPLFGECPTQPLIDVRRITLENIFANNSLPLMESPGLVLCNDSNPCTDIIFQNVTVMPYLGSVESVIAELPVPVPGILFPSRFRNWTVDQWAENGGYLTQEAYGATQDSYPSPTLLVAA